MPIFGIDKCCFCFDHLNGVRALGFTFLVLSLLSIGSTSVDGDPDIAVLVSRSLFALSSLLLINGVNREKWIFLIPFMVFAVLAAIVDVALAGTIISYVNSAAVAALEEEDPAAVDIGLVVVVVSVLFVDSAFCIYSFLVVLALCQKMGPREENKR